MRVLMLAPLPPPSGGIASWTVRFVDYCNEKNIPLSIVNIALQGKRATQEVMKRRLSVEIKRTFGIVHRLKRELKKFKPEVVHINTSCQPLGVIRDALCAFIIGKRIPIVLHCRCNIIDQLGTRRMSRMAFKYLVDKSQRVVVLNKFSKEYVDSCSASKSVFIPNFVDEKMLDANHTIREKIKTIVFVGHLEKAKGILQIYEAARNMDNIDFILIGADREQIQKEAQSDNIHFTGRVGASEIRSYLQKADLFLFPSESEGFSNAVLEAMAMGVPIVASDVGANSEMIESDGGIILPKNTGTDICNAIRSLENPQLRKQMSQWNFSKVRTMYSESVVMNQYIELYNNVLKESAKK